MSAANGNRISYARPRQAAVLVSMALLAASSSAAAWADFGHMEVAAVAYKHLKKKTKTRVAELLRLNPRYGNWIVGAPESGRDRAAFLRAATWADSIKGDKAYRQDQQSDPSASQNIGYADRFTHNYWHYINLPFSPDGTPLLPAVAPNVATQIATFRSALSAPDTSDDVKSYDLVWLLHLVGDVHQPLHCVARFDAAHTAGDQGGNLVKISGNSQPPVCDDPRYCPFDPADLLHAFYDAITGSSYATDLPSQAAAALPAPDAQQAAIRDEQVWVQEGFALAQSDVYVSPIGVGAGPFPITPAYQAAASQLGKRRIALAGVRLAHLLNDALGK
jgi:hypothetical protein